MALRNLPVIAFVVFALSLALSPQSAVGEDRESMEKKRERLADIVVKLRKARALDRKVQREVIGGLEKISTGQQYYRAMGKKTVDGIPRYGTLAELAKAGFLSSSLADGKVHHYRIKLKLTRARRGYQVLATTDKKLLPSFFLNQSGRITFSLEKKATATSPPIKKHLAGWRDETDFVLELSSLLSRASKEMKKEWQELTDDLTGGDSKKMKALLGKIEVILSREKKEARNDVIGEMARVMKQLDELRQQERELVKRARKLMDKLTGGKKKNREKVMMEILKKHFPERYKKLVEKRDRAEKTRRETAVLRALYALQKAQGEFREKGVKVFQGQKLYGNLKELETSGYISNALADGRYRGYFFKLSLTASGRGYQILAVPQSDKSGKRSYYLDSDGNLTYSDDGKVPHAKSPSLK